MIVWVLQEGETVSTVNWCRGVQEMGRRLFRKLELGAVPLSHAEVDIPGLVMTNTLLLKMVIEIVDLPVNSMVIFQLAMLVYQRVSGY